MPHDPSASWKNICECHLTPKGKGLLNSGVSHNEHNTIISKLCPNIIIN